MGRREAKASGRRSPPRPLIRSISLLARAIRSGPGWDPYGDYPPPEQVHEALVMLSRALARASAEQGAVAPGIRLLRFRRGHPESLASHHPSGRPPEPSLAGDSPALEYLLRTGRAVSIPPPVPAASAAEKPAKRPGHRRAFWMTPLLSPSGPAGAIGLSHRSSGTAPPAAARKVLREVAGILGPLLFPAAQETSSGHEQRRPLELLAENYAQLLEKIVDSSVDAIVVADRRGTILLFNAGAERISGYGADEVIGKLNVEALYAPKVAREIMRRLRSAGFGGRGKLLDSVEALRTKDGREIPIHISAAMLYENGRELATVGVFTDLRDLLRLERGIRESEELHRMVVEQAEAGIGIVQRGRLHFANRRLREILKIPAGQTQEVPLSRFLDPSLIRALGLLSSAPAGEKEEGRAVEAEIEIRGRRGVRRSVEIVVGAVRYRGAPAHQIHLRDISARREIENTYRVLVDTAARARQGIILVREALDEPGAVLYANEEFCRFTGWTLEELRKLTLTRLFSPEGLRTATKVYGSLIRGEILAEPTRVVLRTRGGERIIVETSTARTTYQGRPALIGYCRDVTTTARLERLIEKQSRVLADKNKALEDILHRLRSTQESLLEQQKLAELGIFSAGIAHEIRNPLGLIRSHLRTLEESQDERARARALRGIERQIDRSSDFIEKLLSYARPASPVRRRLDVNRTLSMAARFAEEAQAPPGAVSIRREFEEGLPPVTGDHTQIQEVFINLITNALQAVGRWGTIRLVTGREGPDRVRVEVSDTGPGIEESALEKVFRPFYTSGKGSRGTGMGLAISRRIVEGHQGEILALRNPGGGTTLRVLLPVEARDRPVV